MNATDPALIRCAEAMREYRENPREGGFATLKAMVGKEAKRLRMSPGSMFAEVHRLASEPAASRSR